MAMKNAPNLVAHWFHALENEKSNVPSVRIEFSDSDSEAIEKVYQKLNDYDEGKLIEKPKETLDVLEDYLFEVNVTKRQLYPIYWPGKSYEVVRGTWFYATDMYKFLACDELLSQQIEEGYQLEKPWLKEPPSSIEKMRELDNENINNEKNNWKLTGPYIGQSISYTGPNSAWLLSTNIAFQLARAVMTKLTNNENIGGTRLIRGYTEVENWKKRNEQKAKETEQKNKYLEKNENNENETTNGENSEITINSYSLLNENKKRFNKIENLVFVIHGIGEKYAETNSSATIEKSVNDIRKTAKNVSKEFFSNDQKQKKLHRLPSYPTTSESMYKDFSLPEGTGVQFLPVNWRRRLEEKKVIRKKKNKENIEKQENENKQEKSNNENENDDINNNENNDEDEPDIEDIINYPGINDIMLKSIPMVRTLVSDLALDVLYYMIPEYHQKIVTILIEELNRLYKLFKIHNPDFNGKVSIFGHSLGSQLAFDILCHQIPKCMLSENEDKNKELINYYNKIDSEKEVRINYDQLDFSVNIFFALGSPIGLFSLLDNRKIRLFNWKEPSINNLSNNDILVPIVNRMYNIFHPSDPVAHRIEPLILEKKYFIVDGQSIKPQPIPYSKGGLTGTVREFQGRGISIATKSKRLFGNVYSAVQAFMKSEEDVSTEEPAEFDNRKLKYINPHSRLDFMLQENVLENQYLSAIQAHSSYWNDPDAISFILSELYRV